MKIEITKPEYTIYPLNTCTHFYMGVVTHVPKELQSDIIIGDIVIKGVNEYIFMKSHQIIWTKSTIYIEYAGQIFFRKIEPDEVITISNVTHEYSKG